MQLEHGGPAEPLASAPTNDLMLGVVPTSTRGPTIHLPVEFEIRDISDDQHTELSVEVGSRTLGRLTGGSDALVYTTPDGKVEALAERISSRMGRGKDFLVRDPEGRVIGTLRGTWNGRYIVSDAHGNEVARVMPKVGRNNYAVRAQGRDIALISHPSVRGLGGQWKVSQESSHKVDPRLMVILPAVTLFKNREVNAPTLAPEPAPEQNEEHQQGNQAEGEL